MLEIRRIAESDIATLKNPPLQVGTEIDRAVEAILEEVRLRGDEALREYTLRFDRASPPSLRVAPAEIDEAFRRIDPELLATMRRAAGRIEAFHRQQMPKGYAIREKDAILGQRVTPLRRVGVYAPGGTAKYPSTVLMNAIPPSIAGVPEIVMCTPPNPDGSVDPAILCAASIAGVHRIVKCGGAQAVAAMAFGTDSVPAVDKIVGPGNVYVATAKRKVFGLVDIDMIAGPSEILILADQSANPAFLAADMLGQAEHDAYASATLVCTSLSVAEAADRELERQLPRLPRRQIAEASLRANGRIFLAEGPGQAVRIANALAPEHLEICLETPLKYLPLLTCAGSIFLGPYTPEALGDYMAGMNHVLPTSGTARFASPLNVTDFVRYTQYACFSKEALDELKDDVVRFARSEGLHAHARSVSVRFGEEDA